MTAPIKPDFHIISTVQELKECPRRTVVIAADGKPFKRGPAEDGEDYWTSGEIALPAMLIWHPAWDDLDEKVPES